MWFFLLHVYVAQSKRKRACSQGPLFMIVEICGLHNSNLAPLPSTFQQNFWKGHNSSHGLQTFPGFFFKASHSNSVKDKESGKCACIVAQENWYLKKVCLSGVNWCRPVRWWKVFSDLLEIRDLDCKIYNGGKLLNSSESEEWLHFVCLSIALFGF